MRIPTALTAAFSAAALTACASVPDAPAGPPNYAAVDTAAAPPHARLNETVGVQAAANGAYRAADDGGGDELLLFTCTGAPARAFFEALGPWSARIGSEFMMDGRTTRSTAKVIRNLYGVDYCSALDDADHRCVISFNAGDFLNAAP